MLPDEHYEYDLAGNRTMAVIGSKQYEYLYEVAGDSLISVSGPVAKTWSLGNSILSDTTRVFEVDPFRRVSRLTAAGVRFDYLRNGLQQRVTKRSSSGSTTHFVYDEEGKLLAELDGSGKTLLHHIWLGSQPVGVVRGDGEVNYVYADHLNTPRLIVDTMGRQRWTWQSDPFGRQLPDDNPSELGALVYNPRFPGQYFDQESGLHYNYFRDYDPQTGRYTQSDPIGQAGGINTYSYVGSNPLSGIDPLGLACTSSGGKFSCTTPGGQRFGPLPAPPGWPAAINDSMPDYHSYSKQTWAGKCKREDLWPSLMNGPTPWLPNSATTAGSFNNATPPGLQAAMDGGRPSTGPMNPVKSYVTTDQNTGNTMVVNVTLPGHSLFPGYTARVINDGGFPSSVTTHGEGLGALQSDAKRPQFLRDAINNVWYSNQEKMIKACGCR